jgi:hypothetical protein
MTASWPAAVSRGRKKGSVSPQDRPVFSKVHEANLLRRLLPWPRHEALTHPHEVASWQLHGAKRNGAASQSIVTTTWAPGATPG